MCSLRESLRGRGGEGIFICTYISTSFVVGQGHSVLNQRNGRGLAPLHLAANNNNLPMVMALAEAGVGAIKQ